MSEPASDGGTKSVTFTVSAIPSAAGIRLAPTYANQVRLVHDGSSFVLYFFSVPGDAVGLDEVGRQLANPDHSMIVDGRGTVVVQLEPVAKLVVPPALVPSLIAALDENHKRWEANYGPRRE